MKTMLVLIGFAMLCCSPKVQVVPDATVPHQVAEDAQVVIWARLPDGRLAKQPVRLLTGWWIAGPPVVEPMPQQQEGSK